MRSLPLLVTVTTLVTALAGTGSLAAVPPAAAQNAARPAMTGAAPAATPSAETGSSHASAKRRIRTPGSLTGYAFDTCVSPSSKVMNRWWRASPFSAVGVYLSGSGRACPASGQPHLSPAWVRHQHRVGWRILPIHVGFQAPCFQAGDPTPTKPRMSAKRGKAHRQGVTSASAALRAARRFHLGRGSTLYLDIEWYDRSRKTCSRAVLSFIDGWTTRLHQAKFRSGLYSSGSAAIQALDVARHRDGNRFDWPDQMWGACGDCRPIGDLRPYLRRDFWRGHKRLHQYQLNVRVRHGGASYLIDKNLVNVGRGSRPHQQVGTCGTQLNWRSYPRMSRGDRGARVAAAQCLLTKQGFFHARLGNRYGPGVERAIKRLQRTRGLRVSGVLTRNTWVSLLAVGAHKPVVKFGSDREVVWRLQRALVASGLSTPIHGVVGKRTSRAIRRWQHRVDRPRTGVIATEQWTLLRRGHSGNGH